MDPQVTLCNINNENDDVVVSEVPSFTLNEEELVPEDNPHQDDEQSRQNLLNINKRRVSFRWDLLYVKYKIIDYVLKLNFIWNIF